MAETQFAARTATPHSSTLATAATSFATSATRDAGGQAPSGTNGVPLQKLHPLPFQKALASAVLAALKRGESPMVFAEAGLGKTEVAILATLAERSGQAAVKARGRRAKPCGKTLVVVPSWGIADQWVERFERYSSLRVTRNPTVSEYVSYDRSVAFEKGPAGRYVYRTWGSQVRSRRASNTVTEYEAFYRAKAEAYASDVLVSTLHLLSRDLEKIEKGRVPELDLGAFDLVIVDEGTALVAHNDGPSADDSGLDADDPLALESTSTASIGHYERRLKEIYAPLLSNLSPKARFIALTAYPGPKQAAFGKVLHTVAIAPCSEAAAHHAVKFKRQEQAVEDDRVMELFDSLNARLAKKRQLLASLFLKRGLPPPPKSARALMELLKRHPQGPEIGKIASCLVELHRLMGQILEVPYPTDKMRDVLRSMLGGTMPGGSSSSAAAAQEPFAKLVFVRDLLRKIGKDARRRTLVMANHVESLPTVEAYLRREKISVETLRADTSPSALAEARRLIARFNSGRVSVLLTDLHTGGYGLDLFAGTDVIFLGVPPNAEAFHQARGRIGRKPKHGVHLPKQARVYLPYYEHTRESALLHRAALERLEPAALAAQPVGLATTVPEIEALFWA